MDIHEIIQSGMTFKKSKEESPFASKSVPPKKKMSGAQKMRADYKARKAARNSAPKQKTK